MLEDIQHPALEGPVIERVSLVDRITRRAVGPFQSASLPGHLLQLTTAGEARQTTAGRQQHVTPGSAVWYFEDEPVRGEILRVPWTFYTVNFEARTLAPPPEHQRVRRANASTTTRFEALLAAWRSREQTPFIRHLRVHAELLNVLLDLLPAMSGPQRIDTPTRRWWGIEAQLRGKLDQHVDLPFLQALANLSQRSIIDACQLATGTTPMKRVKELRLSYARGLVLHSQFTVSEIAYRTGYSRVQELSRDYHERFGLTPRQDRASGPKYRQIERPPDPL